MDDKELRRQRMLAKAHFDSVLQMFEHGLATKDDLEAKRKIWQELRDYSPTTESPPAGKYYNHNGGISLLMPKIGFGGVKSVLMVNKNHSDPMESFSNTHKGMNPEAVIYDSSFEEAAELEAIKAELHEIDMRKNKKINELAKMHRNTNQMALVTEIKALREEYVNKSDEVYFFKRHGERVSTTLDMTNETMDSELVSFDDSEFVKSLPRDKLALHKMKKSLESSLSKFKARLAAAKTDVKKASQNKNISIATIKINTIDQLMSTL